MEHVAPTFQTGLFGIELNWQLKDDGRVIYAFNPLDNYYVVKEFGLRLLGGGGRMNFVSVEDLESSYYLPPVRLPIHPREVGEEVIAIGFDSKKYQDLNGSHGIVESVDMSDADNPKVQVTLPSDGKSRRLKLLDNKKFIVADSRRYSNPNEQVTDADENECIRRLYYFPDTWLLEKKLKVWEGRDMPAGADFIILKSLLKLKSNRDLIHKDVSCKVTLPRDEMKYATEQLAQIFGTNQNPRWWDSVEEDFEYCSDLPASKKISIVLLSCANRKSLKRAKGKQRSKKSTVIFKQNVTDIVTWMGFLWCIWQTMCLIVGKHEAYPNNLKTR